MKIWWLFFYKYLFNYLFIKPLILLLNILFMKIETLCTKIVFKNLHCVGRDGSTSVRQRAIADRDYNTDAEEFFTCPGRFTPPTNPS